MWCPESKGEIMLGEGGDNDIGWSWELRWFDVKLCEFVFGKKEAPVAVEWQGQNPISLAWSVAGRWENEENAKRFVLILNGGNKVAIYKLFSLKEYFLMDKI